MLWLCFLFGSLCLIFTSIFVHMHKFNDHWTRLRVPSVKFSLCDRLFYNIPRNEFDKRIYDELKSMGDLKFGGIVEYFRPLLYLTDLELIRSVLFEHFDHFANPCVPVGSKDDLFQKMICNIDHTLWKSKRESLDPIFAEDKIQVIFELFNQSGIKMVHFLKSSKPKEIINIQDLSGRFLLDLIASSVFGIHSPNFCKQNSTFAKMSHRLRNPSIRERLKTSSDFFTDILRRNFRERRQTGLRRNDFLQVLVDSTDIPGWSSQVVLTDEIMIAQCMQFLCVGLDNTELFQMYALYELALNPEMQDKLFHQLEAAFGKNREFNYEGVNRLEYLDMVVCETLRKYPPQIRIERQCTKDYKIPGNSSVEIKKGMIVRIPVWSIHHDSNIYHDPQQFIPERFTRENKSQRHPSAYLPFSYGPRSCIGRNFALTAGKLFLAHLVHHFVIRPCCKTTTPIKYAPRQSHLIPMDGVWLTFEARDL